MQEKPITKYKPWGKSIYQIENGLIEPLKMYHIGVVLIYVDGNQALPIPMGVVEKLELFKLLCDIGFKEIEIGFPSAAQTEFDFARKLIEDKLVPEGVALQVLTQSREHLIKRSLESLQGARKAIVHLYNSTSPLQRLLLLA